MTSQPTLVEAEEIFGVLTSICGVSKNTQADFVHLVAEAGITELRIVGSLGFGSFFWVKPTKWHVTVSHDDINDNHKRITQVLATNKKLAELFAERNGGLAPA